MRSVRSGSVHGHGPESLKHRSDASHHSDSSPPRRLNTPGGATLVPPSSPGSLALGSQVGETPRDYHDAAIAHKFSARLQCTARGRDQIWTAEGDAVRMRNPASGELSSGRPVYAKGGVIVHALQVVSEEYVWAGLDDGYIVVIEERTQKYLTEFRQHSGAVLTLMQSPAQDQSVYSGGHDWKIYEWGSTPDSTGRITLQRMFYSHSNSVRCLSSAMGFLVSGSSDGTLRAWELDAQPTTKRDRKKSDQSDSYAKLEGHKGAVRSVLCQEHGNQDRDTLVWSGDENGSICLWGIAEMMRLRDITKASVKARPLRIVQQHRGAVPSLLKYEDQVWSCGQDGNVMCWGVDWQGGASPPDVWVIRCLPSQGRLLGMQLCGRYTVQKLWATSLDYHSKKDGAVVSWNVEVPEQGYEHSMVPVTGGYIELEKVIRRLQAQGDSTDGPRALPDAEAEIRRLEGVVADLQRQTATPKAAPLPAPLPAARHGGSPREETPELLSECKDLRSEVTRLKAERRNLTAAHDAQMRNAHDEVDDLRRALDEAEAVRGDGDAPAELQEVLAKLEELRRENEWLQTNAKELVAQKTRTCELLRLDVARMSSELSRVEEQATTSADASGRVAGIEAELQQSREEVRRFEQRETEREEELSRVLAELDRANSRMSQRTPAPDVVDMREQLSNQSLAVDGLKSDNLSMAVSLGSATADVQSQAKIINSLNEILNERNKSIDLLKEVVEERAQQIEVLEDELRAAHTTAATGSRAGDRASFEASPYEGNRMEMLRDELADKRGQIDRLQVEVNSLYVERDRVQSLEAVVEELEEELTVCQGRAEQGAAALRECADLRSRLLDAEGDMAKLVEALDSNPVATEAKDRLKELLEENAVLLSDNRTLAEQQEILQGHVESLEHSSRHAEQAEQLKEECNTLRAELNAQGAQREASEEAGAAASSHLQALEDHARELAMTLTVRQEASILLRATADELLRALESSDEQLAVLRAERDERASQHDEGSVVEKLLKEGRAKAGVIASLQVRLSTLSKELARSERKRLQLAERDGELQARLSALERQLSEGEGGGATLRGEAFLEHTKTLARISAHKDSVIEELLDDGHRREALQAVDERHTLTGAAAAAAATEDDAAYSELRELRGQNRALRTQLRKAWAHGEGEGAEEEGGGGGLEKLTEELDKFDQAISLREAVIDALQHKLAVCPDAEGSGVPHAAERLRHSAGVISDLQVSLNHAQAQILVKSKQVEALRARIRSMVDAAASLPDEAGSREKQLLEELVEGEMTLRTKELEVVDLQRERQAACQENADLRTEAERLRLRLQRGGEGDHVRDSVTLDLTDTLRVAQENIEELREQLNSTRDSALDAGDNADAASVQSLAEADFLRSENERLTAQLAEEKEASGRLTQSVADLQAQQDELLAEIGDARSESPTRQTSGSMPLDADAEAELAERDALIGHLKGRVLELVEEKDLLEVRAASLDGAAEPPSASAVAAATATEEELHALQEETRDVWRCLVATLRTYRGADAYEEEAEETSLVGLCRAVVLLLEEADSERMAPAEYREVHETLEDALAVWREGRGGGGGGGGGWTNLVDLSHAILDAAHDQEACRTQLADDAEAAEEECRTARDILLAAAGDTPGTPGAPRRTKPPPPLSQLCTDAVAQVAAAAASAVDGGGGGERHSEDLVESLRVLTRTAGLSCEVQAGACVEELVEVLDSCGGAFMNFKEEYEALQDTVRGIEDAYLGEKEKRRRMLEEVQAAKIEAEDLRGRLAAVGDADGGLCDVADYLTVDLAGQYPHARETARRISALVEAVRERLHDAVDGVPPLQGGGRSAGAQASSALASTSPHRGFRSIRSSPSQSGSPSLTSSTTPIHLPAPQAQHDEGRKEPRTKSAKRTHKDPAEKKRRRER